MEKNTTTSINGIPSIESSNQLGLTTEDVFSMGAKAVFGVGLGFIVVSFGVVGIAVAADTLIAASLFTKSAGAVGGGGFGLALGIRGNRKFHKRNEPGLGEELNTVIKVKKVKKPKNRIKGFFMEGYREVVDAK